MHIIPPGGIGGSNPPPATKALLPFKMSRVSGKPYSVYVLWSQSSSLFYIFFFNDTATTEIYPLSLHDALPISRHRPWNLVFTEQHQDYACAKRRENQLKAQIGRAHVCTPATRSPQISSSPCT